MNFYTIVTSVFFTFLFFSLVLTKENEYTGECKDIYDILYNKVDSTGEKVEKYEKDLISCTVNEEKKVTEL